MAPGIFSARSREEMPRTFCSRAGVDLRQHRHIRQLKLPDEVVKQRLGAGVGVGLEGADHPVIAHGPGGGQQGVKLRRVVGIVVIHRRPVIAALVLEPASGPVEILQAQGDGLARGSPAHRPPRPPPGR